MPNIKTLTPEPGRIDAAGLRAYDADRLARCAVDRAEPWWRRTACVEALTGRVPQARLGALLACVRDTGDTGTVRKALLGVLSDRAELLPWLRHEDRRREEAYGMAEAVLQARGALGDLTAAAELATLAFSHWWTRRAVGEAGLDALVERYGAQALLDELAGGRPEDRATAVRLRDRAGGDVIDALADPDPAVAHLAQSLLACPDRIRAYLAGAPTPDAALWAAYALHRLTGDAARTRAVYEALGRPRVEVEGLDEEVRRAIVHEYGHECEKQSDPRWRLEALCTEPPQPQDEERQLADEERRLALATAALTAAGLMPRPPLSCGEAHRQGGGTYHVIGYGEGGRSEVFISTLGPFAGNHEDDPAARAALEGAGFRWIDGATGAVRVTGLGVYYFGAREPLDVSTLLFYWQD
ncbi:MULTISPECIES: hypothetical protein [unclassified Streptomyces]|uniref:hypothetical protein n=1 Tax=unclassified Streptomyces TaxID=2593676 RepID=UPI0004C8B244|nr:MULTISPECIES: hypothetical protein [unclassified Streptomyces]KJY20560.1 hypothetical protein VR43_15060 [Streptomyces sp. NRRL S-104]